jgi:SAM-dependent methyltransferase
VTIDRSRRITFEEQAELYAEISTQYPHRLVEDVLDLSGINPKGRILEIGCGPGNATLQFACLGYRILAIELGERLTALAVDRCRPYPGVEFRNMAFEDWKVEEGCFDLAISADAFHWIQPEVGYPKVAGALKDSGSAAFFWNVPVDPETEWSQAVAQVYDAFGPQVENPHTSFTLDWVTGVVKRNFENAGCFGGVTVRHYVWSEPYSRERYLKALRTYSSHRDLDDATRSELYTQLGEVIDRFGGQVQVPRLAALFHAHVKPRG